MSKKYSKVCHQWRLCLVAQKQAHSAKRHKIAAEEQSRPPASHQQSAYFEAEVSGTSSFYHQNTPRKITPALGEH